MGLQTCTGFFEITVRKKTRREHMHRRASGRKSNVALVASLRVQLWCDAANLPKTLQKCTGFFEITFRKKTRREHMHRRASGRKSNVALVASLCVQLWCDAPNLPKTLQKCTGFFEITFRHCCLV